MKQFEYGELAKQILFCFVATGVIITIIALPGTAHIIKLFKPKNTAERNRIQKAYKRAEKQKLVRLYIKNGKEVVELTEKGKRKVYEYKLDDLHIKKPKKWDKKWRIVIFDIPETRRKDRRRFHWKLSDMGFRSIQKSTFITPYPSKDEIEFIIHFYGLEKYVLFHEAVNVTNEDKLKKMFSIK